ncbi:MAG: hypothetical protein HKN68_00275 [Saprospiraceae bacterium]|nr:hypothetical protein [Saprospiraceae bacterium]
MRRGLYIAKYLLILLAFFSCTKFEEKKELPHYDCFGDVIPEFPFLESETGSLTNTKGGVYYGISFYDDGTFRITYSGICIVDTSSVLCKKNNGELMDLDLILTGIWEYEHTVDVTRAYKEVCGWSTCHDEIDYTYTQLNGECTLTILHSTIPEFEGMTIQELYVVNCDGWSFIIYIPNDPIIGLFFIGDEYIYK